MFKCNSRCAQRLAMATLINFVDRSQQAQKRNGSSCPQSSNKKQKAAPCLTFTPTFGSHSMDGSQHMSLADPLEYTSPDFGAIFLFRHS
jgi:hypothetical protein